MATAVVEVCNIPTEIDAICKVLVGRVIKRFSARRYDYDDVLQEARLSAINAMKSFDAARGFKLTTFVWTAVRNDLENMLTTQYRMCRTPHVEQEISRDCPSADFTSSLISRIAAARLCDEIVVEFPDYLEFVAGLNEGLAWPAAGRRIGWTYYKTRAAIRNIQCWLLVRGG